MSLPIKSKRVPRFVEEYAKDRNGTQAAIRAGYSPNSAGEQAVALLADPRIKELVEAEMARISRIVNVEAAAVLREYLDLATADPSRIMYIRRVNCRYCHGAGHQYQWGAREYAAACDEEAKLARREKREPDYIDCTGGFGWMHNAEPNLDCPECGGDGVEDVFFRDTEGLTGPERRLIAGVRRTKDGLDIKLRDQDGALKVLAQYVGLLIERKEVTGKDGAPLVSPSMIMVCGPDE